MTIQDLTANRDRIIRKIKCQITLATTDNISGVMTKMVAMLPQFAGEKATMSNIDKLTTKATLSYIKTGRNYTEAQAEAVDTAYKSKQRESLQSSLQY